ncbi:hypothetical protein JCM3765_003415 [Sporobolomyces pararoseus]
MDLNLQKRQTTAQIQILIAFTAVMIWDWLSMLPAEYKHIWKAKKITPIRLMYLANRYGSIVLQIGCMAMVVSTVSKEVCSKIYWIQSVGLIYIVWTSDVLLALRVAALYENEIRVIIGLCSLLTTQLGLMVAVGVQLRPLQIPPPIAEYIGLRGCLEGDYIGSHHGFTYVISIAPFVTNLVLLSMTFYRSWKITKDTGGTQLPIMKRMVRDGVLYFSIISVFTLMNIGFYVQPDQSITTFWIAPLVVINTTLSCRLVLSLFVDKPATFVHASLPPLHQLNFPSVLSASQAQSPQNPTGSNLATSPRNSLHPTTTMLSYTSQRGLSAQSTSTTNEQSSVLDEEKEIEGK